MNCLLPGPTSQSCGSLLVDPGTLCRKTSFSPQSLGLAPLALDDSVVDAARKNYFRAIIQQALRSGARESDTTHLANKYLFWLDQGSRNSCDPVGGTVREIEEMWARSVVAEETGLFDAIIRDEFSRINQPDGVVSSKEVKSIEDYQYRVRPLYYTHGYLEPADFLEQIHEYSFLGQHTIYVHDDLIDVLKDLAQKLNQKSAGLATKVASRKEGGIGSVLGIQIRTIAGSSTLSNHAFGMAIDIDAASNPHIVGEEVVKALNAVVAQQGVKYDFGKPALNAAESHSTLSEGDIQKIYDRAKMASDAVQKWLSKHLPRYRELIDQMVEAEKTLGITRVAPGTKLNQRVAQAQKKESQIIYKQELKSPAKVCENKPGDSPERAAAKKVAEVAGLIEQDADLSKVQILHEHFDAATYINTWAKRGIETIPEALAAALVVDLGLRWGQCYKSSKDAMHFELMGEHDAPRIPPDVRTPKPVTLKRLLEETFYDENKKLKLDRPSLLQSAKHRK